jgi:hypothetical protein
MINSYPESKLTSIELSRKSSISKIFLCKMVSVETYLNSRYRPPGSEVRTFDNSLYLETTESSNLRWWSLSSFEF